MPAQRRLQRWLVCVRPPYSEVSTLLFGTFLPFRNSRLIFSSTQSRPLGRLKMRDLHEREVPCLFSFQLLLSITFRLKTPARWKRFRGVSQLMRSYATKVRPLRALRR